MTATVSECLLRSINSYVLSKQGSAIIMSPAPNHLREMAELIYDNFRPHSTNVAENMSTEFVRDFTKRATFKIDIKSKEALLFLLKMTPYYWSTGVERLETITGKNELSVTCDFNIDVFKPID